MNTSVKLIQTDFTYNIEHEGQEYTVIVVEDIPTQYFEYTVFNEEGDIIEDEEKITMLIELIENER